MSIVTFLMHSFQLKHSVGYLVYLEMDAHSGNPFLNDNKVIIGASKSRWALDGKGMICFFVECHSRGGLMLFLDSPTQLHCLLSSNFLAHLIFIWQFNDLCFFGKKCFPSKRLIFREMASRRMFCSSQQHGVVSEVHV